MTQSKTALITGVTGQDGAYLARLLLQQGYRVVGGVRRTSESSLARLAELGVANDLELVDLELLELSNIFRLIEKSRPDEVYNLAAQSFVGASFEQPLYTADVDALGTMRLLEAIRTLQPKTRFYQASTSEMFGKAVHAPQNEATPFYPRSPYGVAKVFAHWTTVNYRESFGLHASSGILFNHESPLRGPEFVTRKITLGLAQVKHGQRDRLELGNLDAERDWGFAGDFVRAIYQILQQDAPGDYVIATGRAHSVRQFIERAGHCIGLDIAWRGEGVDEVGLDKKTGKPIVRIDPRFFRPAEVDHLIGCASKAEAAFGWKPETSFDALVHMMAEADERRVVDNRLFV